MRRKLQKIVRRYHTEQQEKQNKISLKNESNFSSALSINKFNQTKRFSESHQFFNEKNFNLQTNSKIKTHFRLLNRQNFKSHRTFKSNYTGQQKIFKSKKKIMQKQKISIIKIIQQELQFFQINEQKSLQTLNKLISQVAQIVQEVYSYQKVQNIVKSLNQTIKKIASKSLLFLSYCFSAQCLCIYGSYSLSIFYSDKALKLLGQKDKIYLQERQAEIDLYRTIAKIFLIKNQFKTAKHFGYKFLRKSWYLNNFQLQIDAYDLLGKIYHESQQKSMAIYLHERMCRGERENAEIIKISNYELDKLQKDVPQFAVYETIEVFIQRDRLFHEMLEDRYRMKTRSDQNDFYQSKTQFYFHTNRSPNRNLDTYRNLERKMIEQKKSKQLHFIKPNQKGNLKKITNSFQKLLLQIKLQFENSI